MFSAAMLGPPINPDEGSSELRNESSSSVYTISHTVLYVRGRPWVRQWFNYRNPVSFLFRGQSQ